MKRWRVIVAALVAAGVIVGVAGAAFIWFTGGSGEASGPISAPTLAVAQSTPTESPRPRLHRLPRPGPRLRLPRLHRRRQPRPPLRLHLRRRRKLRKPPPQLQRLFRPRRPPRPRSRRARKSCFDSSRRSREFASKSTRFLRGSPKRVVGLTDQVAGDLIIDFASPQDSQLGTLRINVRTLQTDDGRRDRAIRSRILQSADDAYEFVEFEPTSLVGLPAEVAVGDELQFTIVGTLTIREISTEVTFDVVVALESDGRVSGSAAATIQRETFELTVPNVPFVASVGEDVLLAIDFAAERVEQ